MCIYIDKDRMNEKNERKKKKKRIYVYDRIEELVYNNDIKN